jgi:hypothetical protein
VEDWQRLWFLSRRERKTDLLPTEDFTEKKRKAETATLQVLQERARSTVRWRR